MSPCQIKCFIENFNDLIVGLCSLYGYDESYFCILSRRSDAHLYVSNENSSISNSSTLLSTLFLKPIVIVTVECF
jgi:hypothetical protein